MTHTLTPYLDGVEAWQLEPIYPIAHRFVLPRTDFSVGIVSALQWRKEGATQLAGQLSEAISDECLLGRTSSRNVV